MTSRRVLLLATILCLVAAAHLLAASQGIRVYVDGERVQGEALLQNGRTYLPVRAVGEALGCTVQWDAADKAVYIQRGGAAAPVARAPTAPVPSAPATVAPAPRVAAEDTVHVTRTGSKYHRAGCRYLSKSDIPMERAEAIAQGHTPCKVCKP